MSWRDELRLELSMWRGTPYAYGAACRGRGADCIGFVDAVMQRLRGVTLPPMRRLSMHGALHQRDAAIAVMLELARRHPADRLGGGLAPGELEPGDVLVYRAAKPDTPGHVLVVGEPTAVAWHAPGPPGTCVCWTSVTSVGHEILSVWRPRGKELWKCPRY